MYSPPLQSRQPVTVPAKFQPRIPAHTLRRLFIMVSLSPRLIPTPRMVT